MIEVGCVCDVVVFDDDVGGNDDVDLGLVGLELAVWDTGLVWGMGWLVIGMGLCGFGVEAE